MFIFDEQRNKKKLTPVCNIIYRNMELNHIELPPFLVAELYKNSIIETSDNNVTFEQEKISPSNVKLKYLGNNEKNILIIVEYNNAVHLPDEQLNFLTNMLAACKLGIGDTAIVNINKNSQMTYKESLDFFKSKIILLFGVEPSAFGLPVNFPHFQVQTFSGKTYLFTPALDDVEKDKVIKSKVWVCLRRIFGI